MLEIENLLHRVERNPGGNDDRNAFLRRARVDCCRQVHPGRENTAIVELENTEQAIKLLRDRLTERDVVLIKGSRGMQMDRIVSALEDVA